MESSEKRITVGQKKFDKLCANLCGKKKSYYKEITMLKKNLTKQNVQTVLAIFQKSIIVGP